MARVEGALVCILVLILDMVAGILAIEAQIAQNKMKHLRVLIFECKEPSHKAYKLGLSAAVLLGFAHVVGNLLGGCKCICSKEELDKSSVNKILAAGTLILSWVTVVVGFSLLLVGAMSNSKSRASCGLAHHNFLSIGGVICFIHGLFCTAYYVSARAVQWEEEGVVRREAAAPATGGGHRAGVNP
uniref:Tryptophan synthase beta chain n=1 Tax=Anthurium amnicola TaxID=1678845 RepID=A0A1D1XM19_9ARAE